jgi:hypothetical protein
MNDSAGMRNAWALTRNANPMRYAAPNTRKSQGDVKQDVNLENGLSRDNEIFRDLKEY